MGSKAPATPPAETKAPAPVAPTPDKAANADSQGAGAAESFAAKTTAADDTKKGSALGTSSTPATRRKTRPDAAGAVPTGGLASSAVITG
jgi:hypothetical protein